jgi:hypothetical protein
MQRLADAASGRKVCGEVIDRNTAPRPEVERYPERSWPLISGGFASRSRAMQITGRSNMPSDLVAPAFQRPKKQPDFDAEGELLSDRS